MMSLGQRLHACVIINLLFVVLARLVFHDTFAQFELDSNGMIQEKAIGGLFFIGVVLGVFESYMCEATNRQHKGFFTIMCYWVIFLTGLQLILFARFEQQWVSLLVVMFACYYFANSFAILSWWLLFKNPR